MDAKDLYREDLTNTVWLGVIINNEDPLFYGRAKIRIYEKFDEIEDDDLPWAFPHHSGVFGGKNGYGSFSYPKKDTLISVRFDNGDFYSPIYTVVENINKKMQAELKESYVNAQVLVYDEEENLKIIYTQKQGLMVFYAESFFNITPPYPFFFK